MDCSAAACGREWLTFQVGGVFLFWTFGKPFVGGWKIKGEVLEMER
jgi:hypothetical protein